MIFILAFLSTRVVQSIINDLDNEINIRRMLYGIFQKSGYIAAL